MAAKVDLGGLLGAFALHCNDSAFAECVVLNGVADGQLQTLVIANLVDGSSPLGLRLFDASETGGLGNLRRVALWSATAARARFAPLD